MTSHMMSKLSVITSYFKKLLIITQLFVKTRWVLSYILLSVPLL